MKASRQKSIYFLITNDNIVHYWSSAETLFSLMLGISSIQPVHPFVCQFLADALQFLWDTASTHHTVVVFTVLVVFIQLTFALFSLVLQWFFTTVFPSVRNHRTTLRWKIYCDDTCSLDLTKQIGKNLSLDRLVQWLIEYVNQLSSSYYV